MFFNDIKRLQKEAAKEDPNAIWELAWHYTWGQKIPQDPQKSFELHHKLTDQNIAGACYLIGEYHRLGYGTLKDSKKAIPYYKKAADFNHEYALYRLNMMNQPEAKQQLAPYESDPVLVTAAVYSVALCNGDGILIHYPKALKIMVLAAEAGDPIAQYTYGDMAYRGAGANRNFIRAFIWTKKAAEANYPPAISTLAQYYFNGTGTIANPQLAYEWLLKAESHGDPDVLFYLGVIYYHGYGAPQDKIKGIEYLKNAARAGQAEAIKSLKELKQDYSGQTTDKMV